MEKNINVLTIGQKSVKEIQSLTSRLQYGDSTTLGEAIGCTPDTAKKRFNRGNVDAYNALDRIISARENVVKDLKENN
ncbi:hypothetical protein [Flavobacterium geliluteum]|uniref:DNA-binding protein n=1 Tax=Flavobacterium geliluteum TaxID=2816120 RepID=A0A941AYP6_9FLAO|nr:hypothetical protein [Flavobacterium geliluteum]MBP4139661.1 hypothetical protein [Flavobacterium geliluteum]